MPQPPEEFMTVAEVAAILKLNQQTVRNWIDRGFLPALHVGRRVRIKRSDFDSLLQASYTGTKAPIEGVWGGEVPAPDVPEE
jgi:excisionase family DNA binding protein